MKCTKGQVLKNSLRRFRRYIFVVKRKIYLQNCIFEVE